MRLVRWPCISAFGTRESLPDSMVDADFAKKCMGMCILHADMRVPEDMAEHFEERLRSRINSGGTESMVQKFNDVMADWLKLRHVIKKSAETKACFPVTFDGRDAKLLRADWLALRGVDLAKCNLDGNYPSKYFSALHAALKQAGNSEDVINDLPAYASCALHYALAMEQARKMPSELRPDPESAYLVFEEESRLFVSEWVALGWTLKAYGFHLWANMTTLFRRWGSLEGISQQCVEAMIGKVARLMPHLAVKPTGRYSADVAGCRAKELEELERRRANLDAPAESIVENIMLDTLETKYGLTPNDNDAEPLREILLKIDHAILNGNVTAYEVYTVFWRRFMAVEKLRDTARGVAQCRRMAAAGRSDMTELRAEVVDYYSPARHKHGVSSAHTNEEWAVIMRNARKLAWQLASKGQRIQKGGRLVGGGKLVYQRIESMPPVGPVAQVKSDWKSWKIGPRPARA